MVSKSNVTAQPPFKKEHQLLDSQEVKFPAAAYRASLQKSNSPPNSADSLTESLLHDLRPAKLNRLAPHLWLCSTPTYTNIPALHENIVHGRGIIVSEIPDLHLVWSNGRIFVKPLPSYLISYDFWTNNLLTDDSSLFQRQLRQAALGLLRSYDFCIRHESDLRLAQQPNLGLIPPQVTWRQWCDFAAKFHQIQNSEVMPRYHYGKLQLTRLHWLARIYLRELNYYYIDGGYGESFARYYGPLIFIFALFSVLLSAMQLGIAVEQLHSLHWMGFWAVCRWFSITSLLASAIVVFYFIMSFIVRTADEISWAIRAQYRARPRPKATTDAI